MGRINIAGAGLAGLSAAVSLAKQGMECNLISYQPSERAQSALAEGGINAAMDTMGENDTVEEHFFDTIKGGVYLADPNAVMGLVKGAPKIIEELLRLGVPFHMEKGRMIQRNFGGQKKKRTSYAKSSTGKIIMSALIDEARKYEAMELIARFPRNKITDVVIDNGECAGVKMYDARTMEAFFCEGAVILAAGGLNGLFPGETTGTVNNTADIAANVFLKGAEAANLEFIQYHPTTVKIPGKRMLISEAARGEGGRLFTVRDGKKWYFMEEMYPSLGNLMPRDVISGEMFNVMHRADCGGKVYLDLTGLSKEIWSGKLSDMREEIVGYLNIDPSKNPFEVSPGIHFFMGGINVDEYHRTSIKGLYAAGECACQYHGANRLGGNSMLGAIYGGSVAAKSAAADNAQNGKITAMGRITDSEMRESQAAAAVEKKLLSILSSGLGIVRDENTIAAAIDETNKLLCGKLTRAEKNRILLGQAMLLSAIERRESRGAHCRSDYPKRDDVNFRKTTICTAKDDKISVELRSLPERREAYEI